METITRQLPQPITPKRGNEDALTRYTQEQKENIYLWRAIPDYQRDVLSQDVLNVIGARHNLKLTYDNRHEDSLIAKDDKGTTYYLVGSWWDCRFICRGLLKRRKGVKRATYFCNGQASTGTIEVEHYGEQLQIRYPEIQEIYDKIRF